MRWISSILLILFIANASSPPVLAADRDDALKLIEKAIEAHGGADKLKKSQLRECMSQGVLFLAGKEQPFTSQQLLDLPRRMRSTTDLKTGPVIHQIIVVLDDDQGWQSAGGASQPLGRARIEELREELFVRWVCTLIPLANDTGFELISLSEALIEGRPAPGVKVRGKKNVLVSLYFDKQTHLLLSARWVGREAGQQVERELLFSQHKEFEGLQMPTQEVSMRQDKKVSQRTITSYRFPATADRNAFDKP